MDSMSSNKVWTLVDPPKGVKPVGVNGSTNMDMKTTFLNGFVEEEIYMDQPEGFTSVGEEQKVCHLQRSIYRLKKASRSWNIHFDEVIRGYDFIKTTLTFVYTKRKQSPKIDEELRKMFDVHYASAVGSIQYVVQCIMPDIAFSLSVTSRYQACAGEAHWTVVKTILKYLRRTKDMFLMYGGGELILEGYIDASFQFDEDDAKSQSRFVFKLNGGMVAWKSLKQDTTADSTTEAEYIAASEATKDAVWMKNYIQELGVVLSIAEPVVIFCDNNGAITEMVGRGDVRIDRVTSAENMADPLAKPVSQIAHAQHLGKMGLRNMSD
ncbi:UNVERIFIED_CONTAM: Retrovirus-related Pol polyprotein from transposon TNT 1-94 [Sesamum radiatum]|uniref:Retrovirus-related Pol polyprotein from transposon TNT 1-94 n=1 Tax=Sesamum radiatum TaxID=300843 RepID=A0AAW2R003_SESRA